MRWMRRLRGTRRTRRSRDGRGLLRSISRAALIANAIVAVMVLVEFAIFAIRDRDPGTLGLGLTLILGLTVAVWGAAAVIGLPILAISRLLALIRGRLQPPPPPLVTNMDLWDAWLDGPSILFPRRPRN